MSEKAPSQPSSKEDLDQLSALEESMAPFGMGDLDSEHGVILKDWSAQDFANIYVRFRPHLISHARKFLREETQAEEVVQDAFLYLMTALPELDSELGVLRFLKWKTKMLCFDLLRASERVPGRLESVEIDLMAASEDVSEELERASDSALVATALARLSPRYREAIVSSLLLEEPNSVTAAKMGLSENGFRQLLYRARKAFRVSFVGEANTDGKSVSEILSIAVKKAAADKVLGSGLVLAVMLTISLPLGVASIFSDSFSIFSASRLSTQVTPPVLSPQFRNIPEGAEVSTPGESPEIQLEVTKMDAVSPALSSPEGQNQEDFLASPLVEGSPEEEGLKEEPILPDMDLHPIVEDSTNWASALLTDLGRTPVTGPSSTSGLQTVVQIGEYANLVLTFEDEQTSRLAFAIIEGVGDRQGLVAIPTVMYQKTLDVIDGKESAQVILAGFAVSSLVQSGSAPVIENGYFSQIALEVRLSSATNEVRHDRTSVVITSLARS